MALITLEKANIAFGHHLLLDEVNFSIEKGDKVALIGRNGTGKSTLLKVLSGNMALDTGTIKIQEGSKVVYVAQEPELNPNLTIFEEVLNSFGDLTYLLNQYNSYLQQPHLASSITSVSETNSLSESQLADFQKLHDTLEQKEVWTCKNTVNNILSKLNLDGNLIIGPLSGGIKKRAAIAKALVLSPDVLLLDEPTNHLDIENILGLEKIINSLDATVIFITHDRAFLNKIANRIFELDRGKIKVYPGNYATYQRWKSDQLLVEAKRNAEFDKFLAQEEVWIRKGIEARRTRNSGRVDRLKKLREAKSQRREQMGKVEFKVDLGNLSGKLVAKLEDVSLQFENHKALIKNFSTVIMRGDKVGLIGPNGIGKSTLLKIILGLLKPSQGKVTLGTNLKIAYFDQLREHLDLNATVIDTIADGQEFVEINERRIHVATYLQDFLFTKERFHSPVSQLSGGERNRLLIAKLFSKPANVLIMDEPTNDLDIETLELLEDILINYPGTVFLVSHDREFLDQVVTSSLIFLGEGKIEEVIGGYEAYNNYLSQQKAFNSSLIKEKPTANSGGENLDLKTKDIQISQKVKTKLSYKEKLELENLPSQIEALEVEQQDLQQKLLDPESYKTFCDSIGEWKIRLQMIELEIEQKMTRWEELEKRSEKLNS